MNYKLLIVICVSLIVFLIIISHWQIGEIAFGKTNSGGAKSFGLYIKRSTKLYTVMFIVVAVLFLRLFDKISGEGTLSILSGVAGYILGTGNKSDNINENKNGDEN